LLDIERLSPIGGCWRRIRRFDDRGASADARALPDYLRAGGATSVVSQFSSPSRPNTPLLTPDHLVAILGTTALAGLIQGVAGFGSALVAVPLLALMLPLDTVVPLMVLISIAVSLLNLLHLHHAVRTAPLLPLLFGYLLGTPVGLLLLTRAPEVLVLGLLGLSIAVYAGFSLAGRQPNARWLRQQRVAIGALSGALGAAFSTNGPPVILHVSAHGEWGADRQKAALTLFFLVSGTLTALAQWGSGLITARVIDLLPWCLPPLLLGALGGARLYRRLGAHDYRRLVFALVLATGLVLVGCSLYTWIGIAR
jgi:hypothetical protein